MKSVVNQRSRGRRFVVGLAGTCLAFGFYACSSSSEHKVAPHESAGGAGSGGQAGAPQVNDGSDLAGATSGGQAAGGGRSSQAGAGGNDGWGGEPTAGGQAVGGGASEGGSGASIAGAPGTAGEPGSAGAGGQPAMIDPVCGANLVQVGAYSLWCGKVNEHQDALGGWQPDPDCTSGCNIKGVAYCQKFYPTATAVVDVPQVDVKDWKNAGFSAGAGSACNDSSPDGVGISGQAVCCAPIE